MSTFLGSPVFGFKWAKSVYLCGFPRETKARHFVKMDTKCRALVCVYLLPKVLFLGVCATKSAPSGVAFAPAAKVAIRFCLRLQSARFAPLDLSKTCFIWSKRFFTGNRKRPRNFAIAGLCYFIQ